MVRGLAVLNDELYVLRSCELIDVYSTTEFSHLRDFAVPQADLAVLSAVASCPQKHRVYIADSGSECIHRLGVDGWMDRLPLRGYAALQPVTPSSDLLLIGCSEAGGVAKLTLISSESGECLQEVTLTCPGPVGNGCTFHAVQISDSQYVVSYQNDDETAEVIRIGSDGSVLQRSDDGARVSFPYHMVADRDRFLFVAADFNVGGVVMFDPSLKFVREIQDGLETVPVRLHLDEASQCLYVGGLDGKVIVVQL